MGPNPHPRYPLPILPFPGKLGLAAIILPCSPRWHLRHLAPSRFANLFISRLSQRSSLSPHRLNVAFLPALSPHRLHPFPLPLYQAESFYSYMEPSARRTELVEKISSGPITVLALEKPFAVEGLAYLLGPEDGSIPGSLRARFGELHGSESLSSAAKDLSFFFGDLLSTPSETFAWIKPDVSPMPMACLFPI